MNIYRRIIICTLAAMSSTPQESGRLSAIVGDKSVLCEHQLWTQSTPVRPFDPYLQVEWLKLFQLDKYSRKFEYLARRSKADAPGSHTDLFQLQPATTWQVGWRDMRTRLYTTTAT